MDIIILLGYISTSVIFTYVISKWGTFRDVKHQAELDFKNKRDKFYSAFWNFYPLLHKRKIKSSLPKFFIYYLAQRGFITIDVDEARNVRLIKNPVDIKMNSPESFLMNLLFGNETYYEYTSQDSIIGTEAVSLSKVASFYTRNIDCVPIKEGYKDPTATTESSRAIDYKTMEADRKRCKAGSILVFLIVLIPSAIIESYGDDIAAILWAYYILMGSCVLLFAGSIKNLGISFNIVEDENLINPPKPLKKWKYFSLRFWKQYCDSKNHYIIADFIRVIHILFWIGMFFSTSIFAIALNMVTGSPQSRHLVTWGALLMSLMWIGNGIRKRKKDVYYSTKRKANKGYVRFLKQAFRPGMISQRAKNPEDLSFLLPYASLYSKTSAVSQQLPPEVATPAWITQPADEHLSFEEVDTLISRELTMPALKN